MKLSIAPRNTRKRVLLYGAPKSGKSLLAGKLAAKFNLIWFDLENGHSTLFQLPPEQQERIELISIPDTRSWPIAIETMLKVVKGGQVSICQEHGKVDCALCSKSGAPSVTVNLSTLPSDTIVVFDSLTQLTNSAIANITRNQPDDYKLQHDDWGNLGKFMDMFFSHIQQAPFNCVAITHETEAEMEDGKNKLVPTAGTRNFSRNIAKYFDEVFYLDVKLGKHTVASSTTWNPKILTGSRAGLVMEKQTEPSLIPIFTGEIPSASINSETPAVVATKTLNQLSSRLSALKR